MTSCLGRETPASPIRADRATLLPPLAILYTLPCRGLSIHSRRTNAPSLGLPTAFWRLVPPATILCAVSLARERQLRSNCGHDRSRRVETHSKNATAIVAPTTRTSMTLEPEDHIALADAVNTLESPGLAIQITDILGVPIEYGVGKLPAAVSRRISETTNSALRTAFRVAISTMNNDRGTAPSKGMHKMLATLSGAVGGAFGLPALAVELPVSTTIILRSMADIARGQGENIRDIDTQLACLEVSIPYCVQSLATDKTDCHLRRIVWRKNWRPKKVAKKRYQ